MNILNILIPIGICVLLFLIFRAFVLWYWKVDEIVKLLKEIAGNTKKESKEGEK